MSGAASFHGETDHPQSRYYAAMNLKNWQIGVGTTLPSRRYCLYLHLNTPDPLFLLGKNRGVL